MSDNITDYATKQKKALQGAYSTQDTTDGATTGDTSTYDDLRNQNFASYLDAQISLESAKQNALKNTGNALRASGMGNGGYAAISNNGIANSYLTALGNAQTAYQTQNNSINEQEQAANQSDINTRLSAFTGQMNSDAVADTSSLNKVVTGYGYGSLDSDGNLVWNDSAMKSAGFSDDEISEIKVAYDTKFTGLDNSEWKSGHKTYSGAQNAIDNMVAEDGIKANSDKGYGLQDEINYLYGSVTGVKNGDTYKLVNGNHDSTYVYMTYKDGVWYQSTEADYNKAKNGGVIRWGALQEGKGSAAKNAKK